MKYEVKLQRVAEAIEIVETDGGVAQAIEIAEERHRIAFPRETPKRAVEVNGVPIDYRLR